MRQARRDPKQPRGRPIDRLMTGEGLWLGTTGEPAWPVVTDPAGTVGTSYGVYGHAHNLSGEFTNRPALFVIDRDGVIRFVQQYRSTLEVPASEILQVLDDLEEKRLLIAALKNGDAERAEAASVVLGPLGPESKKAIPVLRRALQDSHAGMRASAAAAFCWLGFRAEAAVPALAKALEDEDRRVRRLSAEALARIGPRARAAAPALIKALNDADEQARRSFAEVLRRAPRSSRLIFPTSVREIPLSDEHVRVRSMAVAALERIGAGAVPALTDALKSADPAARINAAEVLGRLGNDGKPAVAALATLLRKDKDARVRETVAEAFARLDHYDPVLVEALKDEDPQVRAMAATAIHDSGGLADWEAVVAVIEVLVKDRDASVRARGYYVLDHRSDASVPTLIKGLQQKNTPMRAGAVELLGQLADEAIQRKEEGRLAVGLLEQALPALQKATKDDEARVRSAAVAALKKLEALKKRELEKRSGEEPGRAG